VELFSVCLWALPPNTAFDKVKLDRWPQQYIQAAGTRDRMTVEIRRDAPVGERQFVLGWSNTIEDPSEEIRWDEFSTVVYSVELFTAALAVPLFMSYMQTGDIPAGYTERPLDL
jgi:hypothetical protein